MTRKLWLSIILIISVFALAYYAYSTMFRANGMDIILTPTNAVYKKRPAERGGKVIAYADNLIYENLKSRSKGKTSVEVLPEPELPVKLEYQQIGTDSDTIDAILSGIDIDDSALQDQNSGSDMSDILETVVVNELNEVAASNDDTGRGSADVDIENIIDKLQGQETAIHDPKLELADSGLNITTAATGSFPGLVGKTAVKENGYGNNYKLQLSVVSSEAEVEAEWRRIMQQNAEILKDSDLMVRKIVGKNDRIFFQIMSGSYKSLSKAKSVCRRLIERKQSCIVTR